VRGQFYGLAAAIGKIGAFVGFWGAYICVFTYISLIWSSVFPPIIQDFGGANSAKGNSGPFWVGSGMLPRLRTKRLQLIFPARSRRSQRFHHVFLDQASHTRRYGERGR
jgi:hypothetical protein